MPTPENSLLNRGTSGDTRISEVIFENEMLKIQLQQLTDQLESSGIAELKAVKEDNERLRRESAQLRVQTEEMAKQLGLVQTSDKRFTTIDDALQQLLAQLQEQREELSGLKITAKEKDDRIIDLTLKLEKQQRCAETQEQRATQLESMARTAEGEAREEKMRLEESLQLHSEETERVKRQLSDAHMQLQESTARAEALSGQLRKFTEEAEQKSRVRIRAVAAQEQDTAQLKEELNQHREQLEQSCDVLREELMHLQSAHRRVTTERDNALARVESSKVAAATAAARAATTDLSSAQVRAYVEKRVAQAVESSEASLKKQNAENLELRSRIALLQMEYDALKKTVSNPATGGSSDNDDFASKRNGARRSMQNRVELFLQQDAITKEDIQLLLQDMLDYQEKMEEDTQTQLLIHELQATDTKKVLQHQLRSLQSENKSLSQQLHERRLALRNQGSSTGFVATQSAAPPASAMVGNGNTPVGAGTRPPLAPKDHEPTNHGTMAQRLAPHPTATLSTAPQQFIDPSRDLFGYNPPPGADAVVTPPIATRDTLVCCPMCTYEQKYSNRKCEICDAVLLMQTAPVPNY